MRKKIFVEDTGTVISVDTTVDINTATGHFLDVTRPDGSTVIWNATKNGTFLEYITKEGDLSQSETYIIRARIETPAGNWRGTETTFKVFAI
ncbi:MAG: hypothetical protein KAI39_12275 [Desulfobulbaceae bacterium]|nr:hypothetical protein [Desulfobulbaceae bacterium]